MLLDKNNQTNQFMAHNSLSQLKTKAVWVFFFVMKFLKFTKIRRYKIKT